MRQFRVRSNETSTSQQEQRPLLWEQGLDLQPVREPTGCCRSRCQEQVSPQAGRQEVWEQCQLVSIVQNKQPAAMRLQPGLDRLDCDLLLFDRMRAD